MVEILNNIKLAFSGIFEYFSIKSISSVALTIAAYLVGAEHIDAMNALMLLVVIDFITGLSSAKSTGEIITSKKSMRSAIKVVVYSLLVTSAHLAENVLPGDSFFENIVISFLALTEFISILENIGRMGYAVPLKLLNKLQELRDQK